MDKRYIDLSHPIEPSMPVLPNYPPVEVTILDSTAFQEPNGGRRLNSSRIAIGLHTGTHMDAPFHFYGDGATMESVPLEQCVGEAALVRLSAHGSFAPIEPIDVIPYKKAIQETRKVVFDTDWSRMWGDPAFFLDHPEITQATAEILLEWGVRLVGVDFPSVDRAPHPAHLAFLGSGVVIVENLANLGAIRGERFRLTALPLKLAGRDGSPIRAIGEEI